MILANVFDQILGTLCTGFFTVILVISVAGPGGASSSGMRKPGKWPREWPGLPPEGRTKVVQVTAAACCGDGGIRRERQLPLLQEALQ